MRWTPRELPLAGTTNLLTAEVTKDPLLSVLLAQRGVKDFESARAFFRHDLNKLHDPYRMLGMEKAVERIEKARLQQEHVMIYGDYDVDGTTSVALMSAFLDGKFPMEQYIPDRYKEGYGLSFAGINLAQEMGISLIIALDCGIKAFDQIAHANLLGIDVIVCDHHRPEEEVPAAYAILDPKQPQCPYPYKELSAAGVGFKLCQALTERWGLSPEANLYPLLDLVAVSIAADIVHVSGENRLLAHFGMQILRSGQSRAGFKALLEAGNKDASTLTMRDIGFSIGPRINAAGRMESGLRAVELLLSTNEAEQLELAKAINDYNLDRREIQAEMFEEAKALLDIENFPNSNVLFKEDWHKGVVGIVASKIVEEHYRPTIILTRSGDHLAGSARSVMHFDVYNAIEACEEHLIQFGGHKYAAGLTLHEAQLPHFKKAFESYVSAHLPERLKVREHVYDAEANLLQFTEGFYKVLRQFEPQGPENEAPMFRIRNLIDAGGSSAVGTDKSHLRLVVRHPDSNHTMVGIAFGMGHLIEQVKSGQPFEILAHVDENEFRGAKSLQLQVVDLRPLNE
ncbi:MAG: single-stranded-DNA-specific exonuclease RecJ [Bacteroidota bacterium]|jgi:single-stranded-DNA-specific exonuclease